MKINQKTKVGIWGFGLVGQSLFRYLTKQNYSNLLVFDSKDLSDNGLLVGQHNLIASNLEFLLTNCDYIFPSPGIDSNNSITLIFDNTSSFFAKSKAATTESEPFRICSLSFARICRAFLALSSAALRCSGVNFGGSAIKLIHEFRQPFSSSLHFRHSINR